MENRVSKKIKYLLIACTTAYVTMLVTFFILMMGFWDVKEYSFSNKAEAIEADFFNKGWLPDFIPESSTNIFVSRNIDINISEGHFQFLPAESYQFIRVLNLTNTDECRLGEPENYNELKNAGYVSVDCSHADTAWIFMINTTTGDCQYTSSLFRD